MGTLLTSITASLHSIMGPPPRSRNRGSAPPRSNKGSRSPRPTNVDRNVKPAAAQAAQDVTVARMPRATVLSQEEISPYPSPRENSPRYAGNTSVPGTPSPVPANIPPLHLQRATWQAAQAPKAVQALPPAHLTGGMEAPAGTKDMGTSVRGVYTAEQQARLCVDEDGQKVSTAPMSLRPRDAHLPPPPGPAPAPPGMAPSAFQRMLPPPPMPPGFRPSSRPVQPAAAPPPIFGKKEPSSPRTRPAGAPVVIMNSVITYIDQEPEPQPAPPKPKPVRVDIAGGSFGYATVVVGANDTAADVAVKVASKRDCRCFTLKAQNCDGVKWSLTGQDLVNPLLNVGSVLIGIECAAEDEEAALGNSYRLTNLQL